MTPDPDRSTHAGPLVKVCGVRSVAQAVACVDAGADWIGLNFHPPSPRFLDLETAGEIARAVSGRAEVVGLFVDRPAPEILAIAERVGLDHIQLHGREPIELVAELAPRRIIRAYRLADAASVERMRRDLERAETLGRPPHAVLIDADVPGREGGTGHLIPSPVLDALPALPRLILAGGLTPDNVAERVERVRPWMVDVASGVESSPGVKDPEKVARLVAAARGVQAAS